MMTSTLEALGHFRSKKAEVVWHVLEGIYYLYWAIDSRCFLSLNLARTMCFSLSQARRAWSWVTLFSLSPTIVERKSLFTSLKLSFARWVRLFLYPCEHGGGIEFESVAVFESWEPSCCVVGVRGVLGIVGVWGVPCLTLGAEFWVGETFSPVGLFPITVGVFSFLIVGL